MPIPSVPVRGIRSRSFGFRPLAIAFIAIVPTIAWPGRCRSQDRTPDLAGLVVDRAGVGVPDVPIWAVGGGWEHPRIVGKAATDGSGRFVMPTPAEPPRPGDSGFLQMLAIARDGRIGWRLTTWPKAPQSGELRVVIDPVGTARGRVQDRDGRPVAGARVAAVTIYRTPVDRPGKDSIGLPPELAGSFRATTAADGSFAIAGIPERAELDTSLDAPGLGDIRVFWDTTRPATIVLDRRSGRVEGRLEPPDARGLSGELRLSLRGTMPPGGPVRLFVRRTATADREGRFRFDRVPPGTYVIHPDFGPGTPFSADPVAKFEVAPDADARVTVPLRRHVAIAGRIVDARTRKGIRGVGVRAGEISPRNSLRFVDRAVTDADGRFAVGAAPGSVAIHLESVPAGYLGPRQGQEPRREVRGDLAWPEIALQPAVTLEGIVVDETGKPVAGAKVGALPTPRGFSRVGRGDTTGPDGSFRIDQLDPDEDLPLWASTNEATTDGAITVRPGDVKGKLTMTIDPKFAFRLRGRVTDRSGRRLSGARVVLWSSWNMGGRSRRPGIGFSSQAAARTTDDSGWFVFRGLLPDHDYKVIVEATGLGHVETPSVQGHPGQTHDLGAIALNGGEPVAGRVVDSAGRPIADASVFNRGDARMPLDARTGPDGRFRLDGLYPGPRYVFARKAGYRFTGAKVDGPGDGLTIAMLRLDEPPPAWKPGAGPTFAEQREFARRVLVRVWEAFGRDAANNGASACIPAMARLDLEQALRWSAEHGHRYDGKARLAAAEELAATDAPGAIELLGLVDGPDKLYGLQRLADRFAEIEPKKALMFAEEAAVQARSRPQPERTSALAEAGERLVRLGRAEAGRRLIDEAVADADHLTAVAHDGYARGVAARALAPFDLDRARKLIEPIKAPLERSRYVAFLADAIAATDPDRAAAMVDEASTPYIGAEVIRTRIAVRLGPGDPDRAIRIIEGMKSSGADRYQAEGFAWLAVAVAPRDRTRAAALIDRALSIPVDRPEAFRSWINYGGGLATAAQIAACARHAGYPDMDSVMMRVMASRVGPGEPGASDITADNDPAAIAAVPLAIVDPGAGRAWLEQIEARGGPDASRIPATAGLYWLRAWALVDLRKAGDLVDAELASLRKAGGAGLRNSPILRMIDSLISPPDRREAATFQAEGPSWRPAFHR